MKKIALFVVLLLCSISQVSAQQAVRVTSLPSTPAGGNVIGHVITDSGSVSAATLTAETTKVIGTVNVAAAQTIAVTNTGTFAVQLASLATAVPDPCTTSAKTSYPINIASATTTVLQAASSSNKFRFCSMFLFASSAENVAVVEDASAACGSPDAGIIGGLTTGTGINLAANQGWTLGSGLGTVAQTASTNVNVCLITSSTAQLSGVIMGVLAP